MKTVRKIISSILIVILVLTSWRPALVLAQEGDPPTEAPLVVEETPSPEPTEQPSQKIEDNTAVVEDEVTSDAITGENTIEVLPTPTPSPTPEEEIIETEEVLETTSEEESPAPEETPEETPSSIQTSDSLALTEVENTVNSVEVNSQSIFHTLNIFVHDVNDLDLSTVPLQIAETVFEVDQTDDEVVNVEVIDSGNFAYLSNDVVSLANTGDNSIQGDGTINTGNAYSIVSLLNKVNTTIIDSTVHFVTINIFGTLEGNIILPEYASEDVRPCCMNVTISGNSGEVSNVVNSGAVSGQNSITTEGEGDAEIGTGNANSVVNVVNIVNTSLVNVIFRGLYINSFGGWFGDFLSWFGSDQLGGISFNPLVGGEDCGGCPSSVSILNNSAYVSNNVTSLANSGGNSLEGEGSINTGNAFSSVNIVNFVNSSIIGSWGFLGFINIFGTLAGNIGGESAFPPPAAPIEAQSVAVQSDFVRETGGELTVNHRHNVGNYVFPGDTVTFFVDVKNPGSGIVYGTKLTIELIRNGASVGGAFFDLGDIKAHKGVKVTTGLVLSEATPPGIYTTRVTARGLVGPGDVEISAFQDSSFLVAGFTPFSTGGGIVEEVEAASGPSSDVMGTATTNSLAKEKIFMMIFILLFTIYISGRSYQKRREIAAFLRKNGRLVGPAAAAVLRGLILRIGIFL